MATKYGHPVAAGLETRRDQRRRKAVANSTPGKQKQLVPKPWERTMVRRSRSYRTREYGGWSERVRSGRRVGGK